MLYKNIIWSLFVLAFVANANAQTDSVRMERYSVDFTLKEGFYLNIEQLRDNNPIAPTRIITTYDTDDMQFYEQVTEGDKISLYDNYGIKQDIEISQLWGYCRKGTVYINYNGEFNRIPVFGSISHFIAQKMVYDYRNFDPMSTQSPYSTMRMPITTVETRQYILDFRTGNVFDYTPSNLEVILMNTPQLQEEYAQLSNRKQRKMMFVYLRRYNELNPLFFPVRE